MSPPEPRTWHPTTPPAMPIKLKALRPFQLVSADYITHLPESNGYTAVLAVVDHGMTKGVVWIPTKYKSNAENAAKLYLDHVYKRFGLPDDIISNRGPQFSSKLTQELL